jgi:dolichyl-phosphooligosaccharide-protein glycotransferase
MSMMNFQELKNPKIYLPIILVSVFVLLALWLRLLPMFTMGTVDPLVMVASDDPMYNLRQTEQILANFPSYAWYDPMSLFPIGTSIYWGPLFPMILAISCIIAGAATRPEIISTSLLVAPIIGSITVAVMYFVGKSCGDWKTGIVTAGFTAVISGQFFYRSFYGYIDHHIAEVLFSTLFCLFYMYSLYSLKEEKINLKSPERRLALWPALAGVAYILGLLTMPTMILFAMIAGIFTIIQFIIDRFKDRTSEYLVLINTWVFILASLGILIAGFNTPGIDLSRYSMGHIYAYLGLVIGTWALYLIAKHSGKTKINYPVILAGCGLTFVVVLFFLAPQLYNLFINSFFSFFGQQAVTNTVQEARGWSTEMAWNTFNYGLVLAFGGIIAILYNNYKEEHPHQIFALVWSIIVLYSTWQHVRYEYYLAINIALLSAIFITFIIPLGEPVARKLVKKIQTEEIEPEAPKEKPKNKKQRIQAKKNKSIELDYLILAPIALIIGIGIIFASTSAFVNYSVGSSGSNRMNPDWKESLEWMQTNTPEIGVNYTTIYSPTTFKYPDQAYGVMSWWDYGHLITYIAKRIPNANPFQEGITGKAGSATFFMSATEEDGNNVMNAAKTRYIVTDIEMDTAKFWAMATWYNSSLAASPYQVYMLAPADAQGNYQTVLLNTQQYYMTMVSRLHNFDGSMVIPTTAFYIEYVDPEMVEAQAPVITGGGPMDASLAKTQAEAYNQQAQAGRHATVLNADLSLPVEKIPALQHYRLVHESPTSISSTGIRYVKTFEYVKGAHISGNGIIETKVVTNTGRNFTYSQESINGEFIVPYTGEYSIRNTTHTFSITESMVLNGEKA